VLDDAVWDRGADGKTMADVRWLFELLDQQGSVDHAASVARVHAEAAADRLGALDWLAPSPHRDVLEELVAYVHRRTR
jgi:geranylgeranyl diphosphate synthase type II